MTDHRGKIVLVRDNMAGIHVGELVSFDPANKTCELRNARKVWQWFGAGSCHGVAAHGLDTDRSKVAPMVEAVISTNVCEIVLCTSAGADSVLGAPEWKP